MNKSTTPRTDAETCIWSGRKIFVNRSLALKLEMELAVSLENQVKAQAEIERLRKENAALKQGKVFVDPKWIYDLETQLCQAGLREYGV